MTVVSAAFRDVLLTCDPEGGHEFVPCLIMDECGRPASQVEHYHFWCGRRLYFEPRGEPDYRFDSTLPVFSFEAKLLGNLAQAQFAAKVPVWVHGSQMGTVYFDEDVFSCLSKVGLSGLTEFSERGGRFSELPDGTKLSLQEDVGHIRVPVDSGS